MGVRNAPSGLVCVGLGCALAALAASGCSADPGLVGDGVTGSLAEAVSGPFSWKGYTWQATTGAMAGVVPGDAANVSVDSSGQLHLKIAKTSAGWSASEVFTTTSLGFGTYQWQIAGPIDRMDHTVVLGLFPYGPQAGIGADGTNEIDTEFSFWNDEVPNVNADWGVYPATAQGTHWEDDYMFSLNGGSAATARMIWSAGGVRSTLLGGFQPLGSSTGIIKTDTYAPTDAIDNVPQQPLPLGMNLWCYKGVPSSGQDVEVVIRDFQFVPEGQPIPGDDGGADAGNPSAEAGESGAPGDDASGDDAGPAPGAPDAGGAAHDAGDSTDAGTAGSSDAGPPATAAESPSVASGCSCRAVCAPPEGRGAIAFLGCLGLVGLLRRRRAGAYGGCPQTSAPSR